MINHKALKAVTASVPFFEMRYILKKITKKR